LRPIGKYKDNTSCFLHFGTNLNWSKNCSPEGLPQRTYSVPNPFPLMGEQIKMAISILLFIASLLVQSQNPFSGPILWLQHVAFSQRLPPFSLFEIVHVISSPRPVMNNKHKGKNLSYELIIFILKKNRLLTYFYMEGGFFKWVLERHK
jgi:hypothetical protein